MSFVNKFCEQIAEKYQLKVDELLALYAKVSEEPEVKITKELVSNPSLTKKTLETYCQRLGLKKTCNKKEELATRILEYLDMEEKGTLPIVKEKKKNEKKEPEQTTPVLLKLTNPVSEKVVKNKYGNLEHEETHFIFNTNKMVVGVQQPEGLISEITIDDIELCKKYNFAYVIPKNLNASKGFEDIKIDEIVDPYDDEDDEDDEVVEEDEDEDEN